MYREYHASPKTVYQTAVIGAVANAGLCNKFGLVACCYGFLRKTVALLKRVAQAELLYCLIAQTAVAEVVQANGLSLLALVQGVDEVLQCILVYHKETLAYALFAFLLVCHLALLYLYVVFLGKPSECFVVAQLLMLHYKMYRVASFTATETLAQVLGR